MAATNSCRAHTEPTARVHPGQEHFNGGRKEKLVKYYTKVLMQLHSAVLLLNVSAMYSTNYKTSGCVCAYDTSDRHCSLK